ncbi:MAG TPA: Rrf2 family transcriptional regulator [Candidatus Binatia bacterium]|jgi:Rrf2 family protein|nr:Rrf2 family transcriptional regulator [Candidatus Binatia bacterium]HET9881854.1 Rrf2 family transcriptional regulator [Candidatus Binatia bacterium]
MSLMQIPRRVDYGLRAIIYLSTQDPEKCCSIAEIARQQNVPKKFLEKIIQDLMRRGLIRSKRGSCGGYTLARLPDQISFYDVIEALEGPIAVNVCMNEELSCDQLPRCAMVGVWSEIQQKVTEVFTRTTLADLRRTPCRDNLSVSSLSSAA